jgi:hypothetical protein
MRQIMAAQSSHANSDAKLKTLPLRVRQKPAPPQTDYNTEIIVSEYLNTAAGHLAVKPSFDFF